MLNVTAMLDTLVIIELERESERELMRVGRHVERKRARKRKRAREEKTTLSANEKRELGRA